MEKLPEYLDLATKPQIFKSISEVVGNTPMVQLSKLFPKHDVLVKLESLNPGGSIKDRVARFIIDQSVKDGLISESTHIIESSSGNLAIGLAMVCLDYGLRFTAVVDPQICETNLRILKLLNAQVDMVTQPDDRGSFLGKRIERVKELYHKIPNSFWTNQYANQYNRQAHYYGTGSEIATQLGELNLDYLVAATSTTGTISGISSRLREKYPNLTVIAVDEEGSELYGGFPAPRHINGIGAGTPIPELAKQTKRKREIDRLIYVTALEAVQGCQDLVKQEGIFAGGSSGAVVAALRKILPTIPSFSRLVIIFPDRGERYLHSFYNNTWVDKLQNLELLSVT